MAIGLGFSPLSGNIYAGKSVPFKGAKEGVMRFTGNKEDVTEQAIHAVLMLLLHKSGEDEGCKVVAPGIGCLTFTKETPTAKEEK